MTIQLFRWEFCVGQQDGFYPHQDYEQLIATEKHVFITLVVPWETEKSQLFSNLLEI